MVPLNRIFIAPRLASSEPLEDVVPPPRLPHCAIVYMLWFVVIKDLSNRLQKHRWTKPLEPLRFLPSCSFRSRLQVRAQERLVKAQTVEPPNKSGRFPCSGSGQAIAMPFSSRVWKDNSISMVPSSKEFGRA